MLGKTWFIMAFAVLATGRMVHQPRAESNLPTVKSALEVLVQELNTIGPKVKALTAENVDAQLDIINNELKRAAQVGLQQAQKLRASGAIGVTELLGVVSSISTWTDLLTRLVNAAVQSVQNVAGTAPVVQKSGKADKLQPGINAMKGFLKEIVPASIGQVPTALLSALKSIAPNSPAPNDPQFMAAMGPAIDNILDQILGYLKGTVTTFTIPPTLANMIPAGLASGAPKGTSTPKGATAPKGVTAPKGTAKGATKGAAKGLLKGSTAPKRI